MTDEERELQEHRVTHEASPEFWTNIAAAVNPSESRKLKAKLTGWLLKGIVFVGLPLTVLAFAFPDLYRGIRNKTKQWANEQLEVIQPDDTIPQALQGKTPNQVSQMSDEQIESSMTDDEKSNAGIGKGSTPKAKRNAFNKIRNSVNKVGKKVAPGAVREAMERLIQDDEASIGKQPNNLLNNNPMLSPPENEVITPKTLVPVDFEKPLPSASETSYDFWTDLQSQLQTDKLQELTEASAASPSQP